MRKNEIKVGGHYRAKVSGNLVTVRVDKIYERGEPFKGERTETRYDVTNLTTGRKTTFRSAMKFRTPTDLKRDTQQAVDASAPHTPETEAEVREIMEGEQRSDPTVMNTNGSNDSAEPSNVTSAEVPTPMAAAPRTGGLAARLSSFRPATDDAPHLIVEARAGTGKTTTLIEALKVLQGTPTPGFVPSPQQQAVFDAVGQSKGKARTVAFCAFNSAIAKELKDRVPPGVEAKTMHSMGFAAIRRQFPRVDVSEHRVSGIILDLLGIGPRPAQEENERPEAFKERTSVWFAAKQGKTVVIRATETLVGLCKMNLIGYGWSEGGDKWSDALTELADRYEVETNGCWPEVVDLVPRVLERCRDLSDNRIDFDDMIWLPVVLNLPVFKFDLLLVDEAQDLNRCQQALAKRAGRRLVLCGDPKQAIYGFAGADSGSMKRMEKELPGCIVLPLTVTRRCGKAIVEEARKLVKDFSAHESNGEGKVSEALYPTQPGAIRGEKIELPVEKTYLPLVKDGDMIVCRSNAPLTKQCLKFLRMGRRAKIQGRSVGHNLISLVTKLKATSVPDLITRLDTWLTNETAKEQAKANPDEAKIDRAVDRHASVMCFVEGEEGRTMTTMNVQDVIDRINNVFADDADRTAPILLSSVHKAKGLEAKRVFYLRPAIHPTRQRMPDWQREEETNIQYVAITRAIEELIYVS